MASPSLNSSVNSTPSCPGYASSTSPIRSDMETRHVFQPTPSLSQHDSSADMSSYSATCVIGGSSLTERSFYHVNDQVKPTIAPLSIPNTVNSKARTQAYNHVLMTPVYHVAAISSPQLVLQDSACLPQQPGFFPAAVNATNMSGYSLPSTLPASPEGSSPPLDTPGQPVSNATSAAYRVHYGFMHPATAYASYAPGYMRMPITPVNMPLVGYTIQPTRYADATVPRMAPTPRYSNGSTNNPHVKPHVTPTLTSTPPFYSVCKSPTNSHSSPFATMDHRSPSPAHDFSRTTSPTTASVLDTRSSLSPNNYSCTPPPPRYPSSTPGPNVMFDCMDMNAATLMAGEKHNSLAFNLLPSTNMMAGFSGPGQVVLSRDFTGTERKGEVNAPHQFLSQPHSTDVWEPAGLSNRVSQPMSIHPVLPPQSSVGAQFQVVVQKFGESSSPTETTESTSTFRGGVSISYEFSSPPFGKHSSALGDRTDASSYSSSQIGVTVHSTMSQSDLVSVSSSHLTDSGSIPISSLFHPHSLRKSDQLVMPYPGKLFPTWPGSPTPITPHVSEEGLNNNYFCCECKSYVSEFAKCWQCTLDNLVLLAGFMCPACIPKFRALPFMPVDLLDHALVCCTSDQYRHLAVPPNLFTRISEYSGSLTVTEDSHAEIVQVLAEIRQPAPAMPLSPWSQFLSPIRSFPSGASLSNSNTPTPLTPAPELLSILSDDTPTLLSTLGITPRMMLINVCVPSSPPRPPPPSVPIVCSPLRSGLSFINSCRSTKRAKIKQRTDSGILSDELANEFPAISTIDPSQSHEGTESVLQSKDQSSICSPVLVRISTDKMYLPPLSHQVFPEVHKQRNSPKSTIKMLPSELIAHDEDEEVWVIGAPITVPNSMGTMSSIGGGPVSPPPFEFPMGTEGLARRRSRFQPVSSQLRKRAQPGVRKYKRQIPHRLLDQVLYAPVGSIVSLLEHTNGVSGSTNISHTSDIALGYPTVLRKLTDDEFAGYTQRITNSGLSTNKRSSSKKQNRVTKANHLKIKLAPVISKPIFTSPLSIIPPPVVPTTPNTQHQRITNVLNDKQMLFMPHLPTPTTPGLATIQIDPDNETLYAHLTYEQIPWCRFCGTTTSPNWRRGPWGRKSLCNKHGCAWNGMIGARRCRLDLSQYEHEEIGDRKRPIYHDYCFTCQTTTPLRSSDFMTPCGGCQRAYHSRCRPFSGLIDTIPTSVPGSSCTSRRSIWFCSEQCRIRRMTSVTHPSFQIEDIVPIRTNPLIMGSGASPIPAGARKRKRLAVDDGDKDEQNSLFIN